MFRVTRNPSPEVGPSPAADQVAEECEKHLLYDVLGVARCHAQRQRVAIDPVPTGIKQLEDLAFHIIVSSGKGMPRRDRESQLERGITRGGGHVLPRVYPGCRENSL